MILDNQSCTCLNSRDRDLFPPGIPLSRRCKSVGVKDHTGMSSFGLSLISRFANSGPGFDSQWRRWSIVCLVCLALVCLRDSYWDVNILGFGRGTIRSVRYIIPFGGSSGILVSSLANLFDGLFRTNASNFGWILKVAFLSWYWLHRVLLKWDTKHDILQHIIHLSWVKWGETVLKILCYCKEPIGLLLSQIGGTFGAHAMNVQCWHWMTPHPLPSFFNLVGLYHLAAAVGSSSQLIGKLASDSSFGIVKVHWLWLDIEGCLFFSWYSFHRAWCKPGHETRHTQHIITVFNFL